jgi:hypothetical protein
MCIVTMALIYETRQGGRVTQELRSSISRKAYGRPMCYYHKDIGPSFGSHSFTVSSSL